MDHFLLSIGVGGDVSLTADLLADAGMHTIDDLMLAEPSKDDLFDMGIVNEADRLAIFYAVHPEEAPAGHNEVGFDSTADLDLAEMSSGLPDCFQDDYDPTATPGQDYPEDGDPLDDPDLDTDAYVEELAMMSFILKKMEKNRETADDWLVATDGSQAVEFNRQAYTRAFDYLQQ